MAKDNKANNKTKGLIDIQGKQYLQVNGRLLQFHDLYPNGSINTEIVSDTQNSVVMMTKVIPDVKHPERYFTGFAQENAGSNFINKTSHYENCETSSRGRALAALGLGIEESLSSAEEVANAMMQQDEQNIIGNLKPSIYKFVKLVQESQSWLQFAFEFGIIDKKKFQNILNTIFDGKNCRDIKQNISNLEKQLDSKLKQLKESEKYINYQKEVENENKKIKNALEAFEK